MPSGQFLVSPKMGFKFHSPFGGRRFDMKKVTIFRLNVMQTGPISAMFFRCPEKRYDIQQAMITKPQLYFSPSSHI